MAESDADPALALAPARRIRSIVRPGFQLRRDRLLDRGSAAAAVLPGKVAIPVLPAHTRLDRNTHLAGKTEVADRHHALPGSRPVPVGKGVELLDIAERMVGLLLHP